MYLYLSLDYIDRKTRLVQKPSLELNGLFPIVIFLSFCIHWIWLQKDSRQNNKTWLLKFSDFLLMKKISVQIFVETKWQDLINNSLVEIKLYHGIKNSYNVTQRGHVPCDVCT